MLTIELKRPKQTNKQNNKAKKKHKNFCQVYLKLLHTGDLL